jgi:hypothetical protein
VYVPTHNHFLIKYKQMATLLVVITGQVAVAPAQRAILLALKSHANIHSTVYKLELPVTCACCDCRNMPIKFALRKTSLPRVEPCSIHCGRCVCVALHRTGIMVTSIRLSTYYTKFVFNLLRILTERMTR